MDRCYFCGRISSHPYCSNFFERNINLGIALGTGGYAGPQGLRIRVCIWCIEQVTQRALEAYADFLNQSNLLYQVTQRLREAQVDALNIRRYGIPCCEQSQAGSGRDRNLAQRAL